MKMLTIDANAYSDFKRGIGNVAMFLSRAETILVPVPVLAELRIGFRGGVREQANILELEQFLSSPRVQVCPLGEYSAILFAEIYGNLKRKGTPIPINDVWIAASAMEHGSILVSSDAHFRLVDGLVLNTL